MPLALIVVTTVLAHAAFNGSRLTISLDALALVASPLTVGVLMSPFAALPMMLGVPAGRLVDRIGVRCPILAAAALLALAVVLPGVVPARSTSRPRARARASCCSTSACSTRWAG